MKIAEFLLARIGEDEDAAKRFWHPNVKRVLDECDAKRRIVAIMREGEWEAGWSLADRVLGSLALPYADHPDYDPEWKP